MQQKIKIKPCKDECVADFAADMKSWLEAKAPELKGEGENKDQVYLLSFHDDGVVWGRVKFNETVKELITTGDIDENGSFKLDKTPSPEFRPQTLQELRLFGENGQIHVWRIGEKEFKASLALDGDSGEYEFLQTEEQVLHGTKTENDNDVNREFTIVADGSEGLRHAFPKSVSDESFKQKDEKGNLIKDKNGKDVRKRPLRLHVKHYIEYNEDDGCARIAFSRLVNVSVE